MANRLIGQDSQKDARSLRGSDSRWTRVSGYEWRAPKYKYMVRTFFSFLTLKTNNCLQIDNKEQQVYDLLK